MASNNDMLWEALESRPIAYHPVLARTLGSVTAAILLGQVLWLGTTNRRLADGWVKASQGFIEKTTALTKWEQQGARRLLEREGVIEYRKRGMPAQAHYLVNRDRLLELYQGMRDRAKPAQTGKTEAAAGPLPPAGLPSPTSAAAGSTQRRDWLGDVVARRGDPFEAIVRRQVKDESWIDACIAFHAHVPDATFDRGVWLGRRGSNIAKFVRVWKGDNALLADAVAMNRSRASSDPMFIARHPAMLVPYIEAQRLMKRCAVAGVPAPEMRFADVTLPNGTVEYRLVTS
jgi:hypothetical protein